MKRNNIRRSGFTLIELLVVIAIIAILAAILFPVLTAAQERARTTKCISNLKQIVAAIYMYTDDYNGRLFSKLACANQAHNYRYLLDNKKYTTNSAIFQCPNDRGSKWIKGFTSYHFNPEFWSQMIDSPICDGCKRYVRSGDHAYYHYFIMESLPGHLSRGDAHLTKNHNDGRPACYKDTAVVWYPQIAARYGKEGHIWPPPK